jgi:hypothetical protein
MQSNYLNSERVSLLLQLQHKSEKFDYALDKDEDCETAKFIYREIKELRIKLKEMSGSVPETMQV